MLYDVSRMCNNELSLANQFDLNFNLFVFMYNLKKHGECVTLIGTFRLIYGLNDIL